MKKKLFVFLFIVLAVIMVVSVMAIPALAGPPEINASGSEKDTFKAKEP